MRMTRQGICLWAVVLFSLAGVCHAQSAPVSPEDEFKQKIRVSQDIQPLGDKPFGENISLYNGSLSFNQTDVDAPGNGPDLLLTRSYTPADLPITDYYVSAQNSVLSDWTLNVPRIETLSAPDSWQNNQWFFLDDTLRCTHFYPASDISVQQTPQSPPTDYQPEDWWHGYQLITADGTSQDLLKRAPQNTLSPSMSGMTFPIVTKQNWMISCLAQTSNGQAGEGFLAVAPDGTKYWFDWLSYKAAPRMIQKAGAALQRRVAMMLASRIEDRFGNSLTYTYDAIGNPTKIAASDGRQLDLTYETWSTSGSISGARLTSATLQPGSGTPRTWTYTYGTTGTTPTLSQVQLPDGTSWGFTFPVLMSLNSELFDYGSGCQEILKRVGGSHDFTVRHPSGLQGTFTVTSLARGRSYTPGTCDTRNPFHHKTLTPDAYGVRAVTKKVLSGAGLTGGTWMFAYSPANESAIEDCASGCASTVWTDVTDPEGHATRHTFSNRFDASESLLLRTDYYTGAIGSTLLRSELNIYAAPNTGPWPSVYGSTQQMYLNAAQTEQLSPLNQRVISQGGDTYTWQVQPSGFNAYAQVTRTTRFNSITWPITLEELTTYLNDLPHWVLGLPLQVDNLTLGETTSQNVYDLAKVTLKERWRFGQKLMSYTFNNAGQLISFTDGNSHTTTLGSYKRGIPQSIGYPDSHSQSLTVDDFGQISAITDQAGSTTSYSYDAVGRLTQITYPGGDEQAWYPTTFAYDYVAAAERGIGAGHWRRTVSKGNSRAVTYFDALLRPVLSDSYSTSDGTSHTSARTDYDWKGQKTFMSYPVAGSPALSAITSGTSSTYDALGRSIQSQQASELGTLTATTAYLSGARQQITDPRGKVTTTSYQVFDQPSYDAVIKVVAPENVTQVITRDLYGNPLSIRQSGLYGATQSVDVTKTLTYDSYRRLCRTTEPESGSEVMAYDDANNLAWSASGLAITGAGCGQEQVLAAAKTSRTYDPMNRVKTIQPPAGTQSTNYDYDALGNLVNATSGISMWTASRNKLGQLTSETLQLTAQPTWTVGYTHDAYGSLSQIQYPDGEKVSYAPDALGRATQIGSYATGLTYFPDGEVKDFVYGNGAVYAAEKNTRQLVSNFSYGQGSTLVVSEDYTYDANGNITKVDDLAGGPRSKVFGYDALNRLSSAQAAGLWGTESYTYDPLNNIRTRVTGGQTRTYNYNTTSKLLTSITGGAGSTFVYDNRGNVINKNGTNLVFDLKNQLTQIPGVDSYAYDAAGRRVMKTPAGGGAPTYYFYNQAGQLLYQVDSANNKTTNFVYLGRKLVVRNETLPTPAVPALSMPANSINGSYSVSWASTSGATSYLLQEQINGGSWATIQNTSATSKAVSGKGNGSYGYRAQACNASGCSAWSATRTITVLLPPATPASLIVPATSTGSIAVSWAASSTATSYTLQQRLGSGGWSSVYTGAAISSTRTVTASGSYTYQVRACNASGCSAYKASSAVAVTVPPVSAPSLSVPASSGTGSYTVSWGGVSGATTYTLQEQVNGGSWATIQGTSATSKAFSGKGNGSYGYRAQACNASGCGPWSSTGTIIVALVPAVPTGAYVENYMTTKIEGYRAHWNAVTGATRYEAKRNDTGASVYSGTDTTFIIGTAFIPEVPLYYAFSVRACNTAGCSAWAVGN